MCTLNDLSKSVLPVRLSHVKLKTNIYFRDTKPRQKVFLMGKSHPAFTCTIKNILCNLETQSHSTSVSKGHRPTLYLMVLEVYDDAVNETSCNKVDSSSKFGFMEYNSNTSLI